MFQYLSYFLVLTIILIFSILVMKMLVLPNFLYSFLKKIIEIYEIYFFKENPLIFVLNFTQRQILFL